MRVRNGFVSNSSTSSFFIYGAVVDDYHSDDKLHHGSFEDDDRGYAVGLGPEQCADDETMGAFKARVKAAILEKYPDVDQSTFGWHEDAYYNG